MRCPRCQQENPPQAKFCLECAAPLARRCVNCGHQLPLSAKFCPQCAHPAGGAAAATPQFGSPDSYTPKHLAERILTSKAALEGERKQVTVLFADLKGSMELLAGRDPEEARKILDPVLELMMEAVHRYEGTVNQVMGDGIMALFGAPLAHEDHAVRACYAALRMQELVKRYAEDARRAHGVNVQIRVGLNSGEVVVRAIGGDLRMDYTAVGQTTHLAARMEQFASPGSILLTPPTLELVEGFVAVKPLGPVPVKGLAAAVEVYEVTGAGPARTRLQAAARRGLTSFVGRDAEVEQLRRAQRLAGTGHGQIAAVLGEAGVGKSRLVYEFTHSHRLHDWLVLESASVSYGKATSYLPVIDLLKGYFKIEDRDDLREIREKVTGKLLTLDDTLKPTLPALLALLDVPVDDAAWRTLDPPQRRQQTLDAVKRLLLREAREQPLLVIFEDLHWIDSETQAVLDTLVDSLASARLLLLVNYRPEYQHAWGSKTYYSQMRLDALPAESAEELLDALLGEDPGLAPLKQLLVKRGNPFFLEETVRTLVETRALAGERGRYRLAQPVQAIQVPPTVQAVLAARIDRLPSEDKRLLQMASVVGKDVPLVLLQAIADLPDETLRRGLDHLQAAEFLYETRLFPELEYTFKHALTQQVAYASLLHEQRLALHSRIIDALERRFPDRLAEQVERLADHAVQSENWGKAFTYLRQAGAKVAALCVDREAVEFYERALRALEHFVDSPGKYCHAIDVRLEMRAPLWRLGRLERLFALFQDAEDLARRLGDALRLNKIYTFLVQYYWARGEQTRAVEYGQRCLEAGHSLGDPALQIVGNLYLGHSYHSLGQFANAVEYLRLNVELLEGERAMELFGLSGLPYVISCAWAVDALANLGEFEPGQQLAQRGTRVAEAANHLYSLAAIRTYMGSLHALKGELAQAVAVLEPTLALCREKKFAGWTMLSARVLGMAYTLSGRPAEAITLHEEAIRLHEKAGALVTRGRHWAHLAEALLVAGRFEEASHACRQTLEFARPRAEQADEARSLWLLGEVAARRDPMPTRESEEHLLHASRLAKTLGLRPLLGRIHLALGRLYRRTGKPELARQHFATTTTMFREMDMRFWLEQAETEMKEGSP